MLMVMNYRRRDKVVLERVLQQRGGNVPGTYLGGAGQGRGRGQRGLGEPMQVADHAVVGGWGNSLLIDSMIFSEIRSKARSQ